MPSSINPEPEVTAIITSETATHVVLAVEIAKSCLRRHWRLLDQLAAIGKPMTGRTVKSRAVVKERRNNRVWPADQARRCVVLHG